MQREISLGKSIIVGVDDGTRKTGRIDDIKSIGERTLDELCGSVRDLDAG